MLKIYGKFILLITIGCLTGCVGLATSIPFSSVKEYPISDQSNNFDFNTDLPRLAFPGESVTKNQVLKTIKYERGNPLCYHHFIIVPMVVGDCGSSETWNYSDNKKVVVNQHVHLFFGFVCSPIPKLAPSMMAESVGTEPGVLGEILAFCDLMVARKAGRGS